MNKVCCLSLVLAGVAASAAFADYTDQYTNVFTGVTAVSSDGVPSATGGTWAYNGVTLSNVDNKVEFEADGEAVLAFTMNAAPQDTNTIFRVAVNGTIEDVGELSAPAEGAQTAFAICTNAFHAWNGSSWVVLDEVPAGFDGSVPTNLLVEINYQGTNVQQNARKARFTVGNTVLSPRDSAEEWIPLGTPANNLTGFGLNGSGTLAAVNGDVMLGVAELDGVKYGTLTEAITKAEEGDAVAVLRPTEENVTLNKDVAIADGGNVKGEIKVEGEVDVNVLPKKEEFTSDPTLAGKSGTYTIPVQVDGGNVNVTLPPDMDNKEIVGEVSHVGKTVSVTIRTAADVITNAAPGGKALAANETKLRAFLGANVKAAYEAADVTSATIAEAISTNGVNNIPLYQSYALGIDPDVSVKPVAVPNDAAADGITLTIPAIDTTKYSGDYAIKYQVGTGEAQTTPGEIKVPLTTGSHEVKIIFE